MHHARGKRGFRARVGLHSEGRAQYSYMRQLYAFAGPWPCLSAFSSAWHPEGSASIRVYGGTALPW